MPQDPTQQNQSKKYFTYFSLGCSGVFLLSIVLFFVLPVPNPIFGDGDPLNLLGVGFWLFVLWMTGVVSIVVFRFIKSKFLGTLAALLSVTALLLFVRFWFFGS